MKARRSQKGYPRGIEHPNAKAPDAVVRKALTLRGYGMSYREISQRLSVPMFTVRDWCVGRTRETATKSIRNLSKIGARVKFSARVPSADELIRMHFAARASVEVRGG